MLDPAQITRNILADKPRVTRFPIDWNAAPGEAGAAASGTEGAATDGAMEDDDEMGVDNAVEGGEGAAATGASAGGDGEVGLCDSSCKSHVQRASGAKGFKIALCCSPWLDIFYPSLRPCFALCS